MLSLELTAHCHHAFRLDQHQLYIWDPAACQAPDTLELRTHTKSATTTYCHGHALSCSTSSHLIHAGLHSLAVQRTKGDICSCLQVTAFIQLQPSSKGLVHSLGQTLRRSNVGLDHACSHTWRDRHVQCADSPLSDRSETTVRPALPQAKQWSLLAYARHRCAEPCPCGRL